MHVWYGRRLVLPIRFLNSLSNESEILSRGSFKTTGGCVLGVISLCVCLVYSVGVCLVCVCLVCVCLVCSVFSVCF